MRHFFPQFSTSNDGVDGEREERTHPQRLIMMAFRQVIFFFNRMLLYHSSREALGTKICNCRRTMGRDVIVFLPLSLISIHPFTISLSLFFIAESVYCRKTSLCRVAFLWRRRFAIAGSFSVAASSQIRMICVRNQPPIAIWRQLTFPGTAKFGKTERGGEKRRTRGSAFGYLVKTAK